METMRDQARKLIESKLHEAAPHLSLKAYLKDLGEKLMDQIVAKVNPNLKHDKVHRNPNSISLMSQATLEGYTRSDLGVEVHLLIDIEIGTPAHILFHIEWKDATMNRYQEQEFKGLWDQDLMQVVSQVVMYLDKTVGGF